jgi:glycosyltransferase involved in cell wall biosynthesis
VNQTVLPEKWVIVSDGSADGTNEIINEFASEFSFITPVFLQREGQRDFGSKVRAINHGLKLLNDVDYEYIGNLDADIAFNSNYFVYLVERLDSDPELGLVGGAIHDYYNGRFHRVIHYPGSVAGAVQFFRRQCFEQIGGYSEVEVGGIDLVADVTTRMLGWKVRTFSELVVLHHRRQGTSGQGIMKARFRDGFKEYCLGHHPVFQLAKCLRRVSEWPYILSSGARISGYIHAAFVMHGKDRPVSKEFVLYLRKEQIKRLRETLSLSLANALLKRDKRS